LSTLIGGYLTAVTSSISPILGEDLQALTSKTLASLGMNVLKEMRLKL